MPDRRSSFVQLCQQAFAFAVVLMIAASAARVVNLDIIASPPDPTLVRGGAESRSAGSAEPAALVASRPVDPTVRKVALGTVAAKGLRALPDQSGTGRAPAERFGVLSPPEPVTGIGTVGVTWAHGVKIADTEIEVSVRTLKDGEWSAWEPLAYHDDHGPDPDSEEARNARPGTDPVVVGDVDEVQVKAVTESGDVPPGLELSIIDPGETVAPVREQPAIDTARLASAETNPGTNPGITAEGDPVDPVDPGVTAGTAALTGTPQDVTPKPEIFSRAQWGADERMRDASSLHYGEVHAGFVHHTVNANGYTRAEVPSIIRGIYAYHTQSKGWSDIGYNFLVDRFGRIWEGRYGGVDRPGVGAHTLGYNDYAFAMSAIGNFETASPRAKMLDAYARLFAWKLSLHGIDAASSSEQVGSRAFRAINGHRDAGSTACPGKYLYAKLGVIRRLAAGYQHSFASRDLNNDLSGSAWPDLAVRNATTGRVAVVRTGGQVGFGGGSRAARGWAGMDLLTAGGDLNGDGVADMVARDATTKLTGLYPGTGAGKFGAATATTDRFAGLDLLLGVGDWDGDRRNDLVGRFADTQRLVLFPGRGNGTYGSGDQLAADWSGYNKTAAVGDLNGDHRPDLVARDGAKSLWFLAGTGHGLAAPTKLGGKWGRFDVLAGRGDATKDGIPDLLARARATGLTYLYPGRGDGTFGRPLGPFGQFARADYLALAGQVAGSAAVDVVGRNAAGNLVAFPGNGRKNIARVVDTGLTLPGVNLILGVGDWNGDGLGDLMTRQTSTGAMHFRAGVAGNRFAAPVLAATGWSTVRLVAAVGDVTGDGYPDLMGQYGGLVRIYPSNGAAGFKGSYVAHDGIAANGQLGIGLWNADGAPDNLLRRGDGSVWLWPGNGPGGLRSGRQIASGAKPYDWFKGIGDLDGDGRADVVARETTTGRLWLLPGTAAGLGVRRLIGAGFAGYDLAG